jgi:DNA polymerase-1
MSANRSRLITSGPDLEAAFDSIANNSTLGLDTETTGLDPLGSRVRLLQIATSEFNYVFDLFRINALSHPGMRHLMESPDIVKVMHNAKFDVKMLLHHYGVEMRGVFDTLLASQLIESSRSDTGYGLAAVCERFIGQSVDKSEQVSDWSGELTEGQYEYAAKDAELMLPLERILSLKIEALKLQEVARLEFDCVLPLAAMELAGMAINQECWRRLAAAVSLTHDALSAELKHDLAEGALQPSLFGDPEINLDSPSQVIEVLGRLGIKVEGTRNWQLQSVANDHPVIAKLLEYRAVQKAVTSYGLPLLGHIHPLTGRLHPDFRQIGAIGGRMSCSDPNLQQVPNTPEYRSCFSAPPGRKLVIADYSQIEIRILADWSQDVSLVKALVSGEDLHCVTASQMFGIALDQVTKDQRAAAKQLNYGIMYGLGAQGLSARIGCSLAEGEGLLRKYFEAYSGMAAWLTEAADRAIRERVSRTRSGRIIIFEFDPNDRSQVAANQRFGKNSPIQGTSADMIKRALTRLHDALKPIDAKIVNCIHDEIVVEAAEGESEECEILMRHEMADAGREFIRSVPVIVDTKIADAWLK